MSAVQRQRSGQTLGARSATAVGWLASEVQGAVTGTLLGAGLGLLVGLPLGLLSSFDARHIIVMAVVLNLPWVTAFALVSSRLRPRRGVVPAMVFAILFGQLAAWRCFYFGLELGS